MIKKIEKKSSTGYWNEGLKWVWFGKQLFNQITLMLNNSSIRVKNSASIDEGSLYPVDSDIVRSYTYHFLNLSATLLPASGDKCWVKWENSSNFPPMEKTIAKSRGF